jgi:imidazolonepropionase-like amidohydrolase
MDRERVLQNQTVIVRNGMIAEIGDASKVKVPKDAVRVDGTGKYLMPASLTCTRTCFRTTSFRRSC